MVCSKIGKGVEHGDLSQLLLGSFKSIIYLIGADVILLLLYLILGFRQVQILQQRSSRI